MKTKMKTGLGIYLMIVYLPSLQAETQCQQINDRYYDNKTESNGSLFNRDIARELPPWKVKIIKNLLNSHANNSQINFRFYDRGVRAGNVNGARWPRRDGWEPYAFKAPRTVINAFVDAARIEGLKPAQRYVVVPGKLLLANATHGFYTHLFAVLAINGMGQVLDAIGLGMESMILKYGNEEALQDNEIILHIRTDHTLIKANDNQASNVGNDHVIKKLSAKQWQLDLSDASGSMKNRFVKLYTFIEEKLKGRSIRIKRIITASHGTEGRIFFDDEPMFVSLYANLLEPLRPYLADQPEFYFEGCNVAATTAGKLEVKEFADKMYHNGVRVRANAVYGLSTLSMGPLFAQDIEDSRVSQSFVAAFAVHPFLYAIALTGIQLIDLAVASNHYRSGTFDVESAVFTYER